MLYQLSYRGGEAEQDTFGEAGLQVQRQRSPANLRKFQPSQDLRRIPPARPRLEFPPGLTVYRFALDPPRSIPAVGTESQSSGHPDEIPA